MRVAGFRCAVVACLLAGSLMSGAAQAETTSSDAKALVDLVKPHERQAQAVRFMIAVSPFATYEGLAECTVQKLEGPLKSYLESMYLKELTKEELRQAVSFYQSAPGQEAVRIRLRHEQELLELAMQGRQIEDEHVKYPADVERALQAFWKTSAGRFFAGTDLETAPPYSGDVTDLRSDAMAQCLKAKK